MLDKLIELGNLLFFERVEVAPCEAWVSSKDAEIVVPNNLILAPGQKVNLSIDGPNIKTKNKLGFSVRSALAQAGISYFNLSESG